MLSNSDATGVPDGNFGAPSSDALLASIDELLSVTDGLLAVTMRANVAAARDRLADERFNLVVLGEFKRGKSTLINALLGRDVVPTGVVPLTSAVTVIRWGARERLVVHHADGRRVARSLQELPDYVTEARNPSNRQAVELAVVELDHALLRSGLQLVDTPGVGSIHSHNTDAARAFLPSVDAALCVLDAGQPVSDGERRLFEETARRVPRLLIVINKIDHLDRRDRDVAVQFIRTALDGLQADLELFVVSAREREGIEPLWQRLARLARDERATLLRQSVARLAHDVALDGARAAQFEAHAVRLPLHDLGRRAQLFEERIEELRNASAEAGDLLDRGVRRAIAERINEPLTRYARAEEARLRSALMAHVRELGKIPTPELSRALDQFIDSTVRADFVQLVPRYESEIATELTELERRYAARVQRILEQVQDVAQDVFGARASDVLPSTGMRAPSRFRFKLKDVEHGLDMLVGFGRTITPGALGRRFVIRNAEQRLIAMADRHAGRLRSELVQRVNDAAMLYRRELAATVDEAIDGIRVAIDRAIVQRETDAEQVRSRLAVLEQTAQRCQQLAGVFRACADRPGSGAGPAAVAHLQASDRA